MLSQNSPETHKSNISSDWQSSMVSPLSIFGDDTWNLQINTGGYRADKSFVKWNSKPPLSSTISKSEFDSLNHAAKHFIWSMIVHPPAGRRKWSRTTIKTKSEICLSIISWMATNGISRFSSFNSDLVQRIISYFQLRTGKSGNPISRVTIIQYTSIISDFYRQRYLLEDAPQEDPDIDQFYDDFGSKDKSSIPFIPDEIAFDLLHKSLNLIEEYSSQIIESWEFREAVRLKYLSLGRSQKSVQKDVAKELKNKSYFCQQFGRLDSVSNIKRAKSALIDASYIVIAAFVGMRVSEILSIEAGCISYVNVDTDSAEAFINSKMFKTVDDEEGRKEQWPVPSPVISAVNVLEKISLKFRIESDENKLFLVRSDRSSKIVPITTQGINYRIAHFTSLINLPSHGGFKWKFSTHQFRKTFARFVAKRDRSQLLGLAQHFKHTSVAATAKGYVGTDFSLSELVEHESQIETSAALNLFLSSDRLAGKMGERIVRQNLQFRGRAGEQVRKDYVKFVMSETDLKIHACDFGWCVFQPETAKCLGKSEPEIINRCPDTCMSCSNMVIEPKHAAYWADRKSRNLSLLTNANFMASAVIKESINQCDEILKRLLPEGEVDG